MAADGTGHTLAKISPRLDDNKSTNWLPSQTFGGTPGQANNFSLDSTTNFGHVLINEIVLKDNKSKSSFFSVEIYNPTEIEIDLSEYWLRTIQIVCKDTKYLKARKSSLKIFS